MRERILDTLTLTLLETANRRPEPAKTRLIQDRIRLRVLYRAPAHLRLGLSALLILFDSLALIRFGRRFCRLDSQRRGRYLEAWSRSRLLPAKTFADFFTTLVLMDWHSA